MTYKEKPADSLHQYIVNIIISIDQFANVLLGGAPDETISSRCSKRGNKICVLLCKLLDKIDPNHCEKYREDDEG